MDNIPNPPNPVNRRALSRASIFGAILGVAAIILFVVFWVVFGNLGVTQFARLFLALCLPPGIIAAIVGGYVLIARPRL
ncbi:MAG: hypothetical protein LC121_25825 [Anaerolineae bacterium]|nr:hypothetical protein [Anaerolineae bacterium]